MPSIFSISHFCINYFFFVIDIHPLSLPTTPTILLFSSLLFSIIREHSGYENLSPPNGRSLSYLYFLCVTKLK